MNRILLTTSETIFQNQIKSFTWSFKAPEFPGTYTFQARMIKEGKKIFFGQLAPSTTYTVTVTNPTNVTACPVDSNCNANNPGECTRQIQLCLDAGGKVYLNNQTYWIGPHPTTSKGLKIKKANTLLISKTSPCDETSCAILKASSNLADPVIQRSQGQSPTVVDYKMRYLTIDGNKANRLNGFNCQGLRHGGANIVLKENASGDTNSGFRIKYISSINALCGSGLSIVGTNFKVAFSTFKNNGYMKYHDSVDCPQADWNTKCPNNDLEPWADGITLQSCYNSDPESYPGKAVHNNTITDSTDIGIANSYGVGCIVRINTITQQNIRSFSGIGIGNFTTGGGEYLDADYHDNIITASPNTLDFGLRIGPHAWDPSVYSHNGTFRVNTVSGAVINLSVDGACGVSGNVLSITDNTLSNNDSTGHFSHRFTGCTQSANYSKTHCKSISDLRNTCGGAACNPDKYYYHPPNCTLNTVACTSTGCQ